MRTIVGGSIDTEDDGNPIIGGGGCGYGCVPCTSNSGCPSDVCIYYHPAADGSCPYTCGCGAFANF